ncbi:CAP domain-containing protein [Neobacillus ginsengisoli]
MNYGFITIDPNSYSTATPSHMYPHSKRVQQGNYWYYTFGPATGQSGAKTPQQSITPQTGQQAAPVNPTAPRITTPAVPKATQPSAPAAPSTAGISQMALQVIELTNNERRKNGLPALKADSSLSKVAQVKSNDMQAKHYFSHTSPTYGSPFDMMRDFGVTYKSAGENIAMGQTTAQQVVTAWMNSEGHRKNILSPNYTNIGVGFTQSGNYWSQMFIGK